jgi:DtxR family Mn-dependent transcriptional regulator
MHLITWIIIICVLLLAVFLPRYGALARLQAWRKKQHREQVEDALKHLLDREQQGRHASPESLAGVLQLGTTKIMRLVTDMESQGLFATHGDQLHLTSEGQRWALHVVRSHRLWERYLADEARMPLQKIHAEAHRREHTLNSVELDALDASLGHPAHDPHGDPIPSRSGEFPTDGGTPLTNWQTQGPARIVHIEDEPPIAYAQILAAGLQLGQTIRILERTPERYVLTDGENEYRLAPSVANNVSVAGVPEAKNLLLESISLNQLTYLQRAEIVELDEAVQGFTRRRFLDLGLTPGTVIFPELQNFFGDPRAYRIRGTLIALRKEQAAQIWVKPV